MRSSMKRKVVIPLFCSLAMLVFIGFISIVYINAPVLNLNTGVKFFPLGSDQQSVAGISQPMTKLDQISSFLIDCVIYAEDDTFYSHYGFNFRQIWRSFRDAVLRKRRLRGASTISQQLVKNIFFSNKRSFLRKFFEAIYTVKLERNFTKNQILTLYLNNIEWGKDIYGIREASLFYFQKEPLDLGPLEAAFLAAIVPNPVVYSRSFKDEQLSEFMKKRVENIIELLIYYEKIDDKEFYFEQMEEIFSQY